MSKGRVWNKGKRNGGGGPAPGTGYKEVDNINKNKSTSISSTPQDGSSASENTISSRVDRVEPMKRENWVTRPKRVKRKMNSDQQ